MSMWTNSKQISEGDTFLVCSDNEKYVSDAIKNGASKIVTETDDKYEIETIKVDSVKDYMHNELYPLISDLTLIGITGTNGKTTTCYLIYQILNFLGIKTAFIGTIGFYCGDVKRELLNTTPSMDLLYNLIIKAKECGCLVVVMEVSSHALKQDRVHGLLFDAVGVTNVTMDHLDYHKTMEDYVRSKMIITKLLRNNKVVVLNQKDEYYKRFIKSENKNIIIGKDVKVLDIVKNINDTYVKTNDGDFRLSLVGDFNVYNFLMAYMILKELGYDDKKIISNAANFSEPPGRMQMVKYKSNSIFIDYAHTPDAVLNVLKTVNDIKNNGVITIVGCGGDRDKSKRPIMAKIACNNSDYVIFTNDNPRTEDEQKIMKDVLKGAKGKYEVIFDRKEAIKRGVNLLKENRILMVLGKGHEDYQIIGNIKHHFSDYEEIGKIINK